METLNFDTGVVTYSINGKTEISFNPTDADFMSQLYAGFTALDKKRDEFKPEINANKGKPELFDTYLRMEAQSREIIDGLFGDGFCQNLFGSTSVYAMASGLPIWVNLFFAIIETMEDSAEKENAMASPRLQKYEAKYAKYMKR